MLNKLSTLIGVKMLAFMKLTSDSLLKEGTFEALEGHLPRIKELGTDIIWLMPIHPIGEVNRKGVTRKLLFSKGLQGQ
jgi:pullulanase/glycogen debranching enzyme